MGRRASITLATALVAGAAALAPALASATRPDDRAGPRGADVTAVLTPSAAAAHPDNRPGPRGVVPVAETAGTNWTAIGSGIGAGAAALLLIGAGVYATRHGGMHLPHRPAHTH